MELNLTIPKSQPEPKQRVRCLTNRTTQTPLLEGALSSQLTHSYQFLPSEPDSYRNTLTDLRVTILPLNLEAWT